MGRATVIACEPSLEGVLAGVGVTYLAHAHAGEVRLASAEALQPQLGEMVVRTPPSTDDDTVDFARRVMDGFIRHVTDGCGRMRRGRCPQGCSQACVRRLVLAAASDDPAMPEVVHRYLRLGFERGAQVRSLIVDPRVVAFNDLARRVMGECERTRQFVRFSHMADGSFAASFSPEANTVPLTAGHFAARMATERFCLVDPRHRVAAFHDPAHKGCQVARMDAAIAHDLAHRCDLADDEAYVRAMWRRFYRGTTVPGRDRSQRGYDLRTGWMPQRLWPGLVELGPEAETDPPAPERYQGAGGTALPGCQGRR